jgi:hypothetical protein
MSVSPEQEYGDVTSNQHARKSSILKCLEFDFSKIEPGNNSFNTPTTGGENKVSAAVACCMDQMEAGNLPSTGWKS